MKTRDQLIDDLLTLAFAEDVGDGDATTLSTIPAEETGRQQLIGGNNRRGGNSQEGICQV